MLSTVQESNNTQGEEQGLLPNADNANDASAPAVEANNQGQVVEPTIQQRAIVSSSENSVASNNTSSIHNAIATSEEPTATAEGEAKTTPHNEANAMMLHMAAPPHYPVAEFLFQLTKMLTDDNKGFIEWKNAGIVVHDPPGLQKHILPKYFRHSNYSSFQRQMNYFGFRKIAGKGKMAACSYVNENATEDISSLLYIKRKKTGVSNSAARLLARANKIHRAGGGGLNDAAVQAQANMNNMMMMQSQMMMQNHPGMPNAATAAMMGMNPMALMHPQQNMLGGMGGALNGLPMNAMAGSAMQGHLPNMLPQNSAGDNARLREQQNILAQLQQAHASATSSANAAKDNLVFQSGAGIAPILTNDQGNLYSAGNGQWNMGNVTAANTNPQALLMQQAAAMGGLAAFPQGSALDPNDKSLESAANFRSFLNQQISLFSDGQAASPAVQGANAMAGMASSQPSQGLSYEQFFQLNGMANGAVAPATAGGGDAQQFLPRNV